MKFVALHNTNLSFYSSPVQSDPGVTLQIEVLAGMCPFWRV